MWRLRTCAIWGGVWYILTMGSAAWAVHTGNCHDTRFFACVENYPETGHVEDFVRSGWLSRRTVNFRLKLKSESELTALIIGAKSNSPAGVELRFPPAAPSMAFTITDWRIVLMDGAEVASGTGTSGTFSVSRSQAFGITIRTSVTYYINGAPVTNPAGSTVEGLPVAVTEFQTDHVPLSVMPWCVALSKSVTKKPAAVNQNPTELMPSDLGSINPKDIESKLAWKIDGVDAPDDVYVGMYAEEGEGGHDAHTGIRPVGDFDGDQMVSYTSFGCGEAVDIQPTYTASKFGGIGNLRLVVSDVALNSKSLIGPDLADQNAARAALVLEKEDIVQNGQGCEIGFGDFEVKVPDLKRMEDIMGAVGNFNLVGQTPQHGDNHYGTENSVNIVDDVAQQYAASNGLFKINDMSLGWGGLFDVCGEWDPTKTCVLSGITAKGHNLHRVGKSVDINRRDASGAPININRLKQLFQMWGAWKVNEGPIHFEMP